MGDRCYMQVTCRRQDLKRFEELGFNLDFDESPDSPIVEMVDEEANHAHYGKLPTDIPYHGQNGAAGNFGDGLCACDGKRFMDVQTGYGGGFVVDWDFKKQKPTSQSLNHIRRYIAIRDRVGKEFKKLTKSSTQKGKS